MELIRYCLEENLEKIQECIYNGIFIDEKFDYGDTALICSSRDYGDKPKVVKFLIDNGANIEERDHEEWTPLFFACFEGHIKIATLLLEEGANINHKNYEGDTILHILTSSIKMTYMDKCKNIFNLLIEHGIDINETNNSGNTPLTMACVSGNFDEAKILLELGASTDVNSYNLYGGKTPLIYATINNYPKIIEILIKAGVNINEKDESNMTARDYATRPSRKSIKKIVNLLDNATQHKINS